jgi:hypothetical protein
LQFYIYAGLPNDTTQYTEHSQQQDTSTSTKHKSVYIVNDSSTITTTTMTQANVVNETSLISNDTQGADMIMKKSAKGGNLLLKDNHANVTLLKHTFTPPTSPIVDCSGDVSLFYFYCFYCFFWFEFCFL